MRPHAALQRRRRLLPDRRFCSAAAGFGMPSSVTAAVSVTAPLAVAHRSTGAIVIAGALLLLTNSLSVRPPVAAPPAGSISHSGCSQRERLLRLAVQR